MMKATKKAPQQAENDVLRSDVNGVGVAADRTDVSVTLKKLLRAGIREKCVGGKGDQRQSLHKLCARIF
jgi:hypothetical protein